MESVGQPNNIWAPQVLRRCLEEEGILPIQYRDLQEAFNRQNATQLPPHRSCDFAINLLPGASPGRGRDLPFVKTRNRTDADVHQGRTGQRFHAAIQVSNIHWLFLCKVEGQGSRAYIDFRHQVKYRFLLPLVPAALEHLRTAGYFTKLDLRSTYNLIRIHKGNERKMAFSTTTDHHEDLVMPFGLCNTKSVFRSFINDVFQDMLNKFVIVYTDDILVFLDFFAEYVSHIPKS